MNYLVKIIRETIKEALDIPKSKLDMLCEKFPVLQTALEDLLGTNYNLNFIIKDIKILSNKPTTFKMITKSGTDFILKYTKPSFSCIISGNVYDLNKINEKQNAVKAINRLLGLKKFGQEQTPPPNENIPSDLLGNEKQKDKETPPKTSQEKTPPEEA